MSSFYEKWIETDYNPFILFSAEGKILSLNDAAQFLLGSVSSQTLFEYATSYAATSFGFKTTHIELEFDRFKFFAICVGYENESEIGIKLYRTPALESKMVESLQTKEEPVNIYSLIDLCISTNSIGKKFEYIRDFDPTIPDVRINADIFIKMFNHLFTSVRDASEIVIKLYFKVGEHIKIQDQKFSLFSIKLTSDGHFDAHKRGQIASYADMIGATLTQKEQEVLIDIALLT